MAIGGSAAEALRESGQIRFPKGRVGRCEREGAKPGSGPRVSLEHARTTDSTLEFKAICFPSRSILCLGAMKLHRAEGLKAAMDVVVGLDGESEDSQEAKGTAVAPRVFLLVKCYEWGD